MADQPDTTDIDAATGCADDDISLERWYVLERLRLDEFMAFWQNGHDGHNTEGIPADAFPMEQPVGEWDVQYRWFRGG